MLQDYIESGVLEAYVTGTASEQEVKELMYMKAKYPEVSIALQQLEIDMETIAKHMAVTPPAHTWNKISNQIDELILRPGDDPQQFQGDREDNNYKNFNTGSEYIEVEAESNHIKVHKNWKWVFAAVFILGKIFLACAIYFYLENRQAQQQIKQMQTELQQLKH
ncbi:hypothetical protein [Mucilaginibacter segetis]|uniref:Uncharacterized protein n=1 Tax=Mucilaginibacter segetis TaxID=2793071 RepID=A0A934PQR5_9SPHI|nr:hypothetical protein [Mucilaginibacter segetis]MBK0377712.1 hypothetical protein [Mucilaginibacter segetis]